MKDTIPEYTTVSTFSKGESSKIFSHVEDEDKIIIVNKRGKPCSVIISYERYVKLKESGADL